jgi:hypothetical protein
MCDFHAAVSVISNTHPGDGRPVVGRWYHVAATFDSTVARLFVDGNLVAFVEVRAQLQGHCPFVALDHVSLAVGCSKRLVVFAAQLRQHRARQAQLRNDIDALERSRLSAAAELCAKQAAAYAETLEGREEVRQLVAVIREEAEFHNKVNQHGCSS